MSRKKIVIKMPSAPSRMQANRRPKLSVTPSARQATLKPTVGFAPKTWFHSSTIRARGRLPPPSDLTLPRHGTRRSISPRTERSFRFSR